MKIGAKFGVSRGRISQILAQALSSLRAPTIRHKMRDYLD